MKAAESRRRLEGARLDLVAQLRRVARLRPQVTRGL